MISYPYKPPPPTTTMRTITAYFHTPGQKNKPINHLVAQYDPPYSHVDLRFEDGMMSSVYQHCGVCWRECDFDRAQRVEIEVTDDGYQRAYAMCSRRAELGYKFDFAGVYGFSLPISTASGRTFCSKHCVEVLQLAGAGAVVGIDASATTPSALFRALEN